MTRLPRWLLSAAALLALLCAVAGLLAAGYVIRDLWPAEREHSLLLLDTRKVQQPGERPVWQIRWLDRDAYGLTVQAVQVEGEGDAERVTQWVEGQR